MKAARHILAVMLCIGAASAQVLVTRGQIFVDEVGVRTALVVSNSSAETATLTLVLRNDSGTELARRTEFVNAGQERSLLVRDLFPALAAGLRGSLSFQSNRPLSAVASREIRNVHGASIHTLLPAVNLSAVTSVEPIVFSNISAGNGNATEILLANPGEDGIHGELRFYASNAVTTLLYEIEAGGTFRSRFTAPDLRTGWAIAMPARGSRAPAGAAILQVLEGDLVVNEAAFTALPATAETRLFAENEIRKSIAIAGEKRPATAAAGQERRAASIVLVDPSTDLETTELVINEGQSVRPRVRIGDDTDGSRDDFFVLSASSNPNVAEVRGDGSIFGKRAGFSTLTVSAAGSTWTGTITVVRVDTAETGREPVSTAGVVQDLAQQIYLTSLRDHTILFAPKALENPSRYAGIERSPGLRNEARAQSQFRNPAFLALNQSDGSLYVTDSANHVIRRVRPGTLGKVETIAGTGSPGSVDGSPDQASFNTPQGIAIDSRGNLWIVDTGNHTIRRVNPNTGSVETIAGMPGVPGFADGTKTFARFRSPVGIAIDTESILEQQQRIRRGAPPASISVLVTDTGNGVVRRIHEDGRVETLTPFIFDNPNAVSIDALDNIYVSEPQRGRVQLITGGRNAAVAVAQNGTIGEPRGLSASLGRLVIADSSVAVRTVTYGAPGIGGLSPERFSDRGSYEITIRGENFSPDTVVQMDDVVMTSAVIRDTETISFTAPPFENGRLTLTIQNRGGIARMPLIIESQPLSSLPAGYITTIAGGAASARTGGIARSAQLDDPRDIVLDATGVAYILETSASRVRRLDPRTGILETVVDDTSGLSFPRGIALDASGNLLIADWGNEVIRRIDTSTGIMVTIAGSGQDSFAGNGGPAIAAGFASPFDVALDSTGNLYISDQDDHRIRRVDRKTGIVTTVAGTGERGFSGDGGPGTSAKLDRPGAIAVNNAGDIYVSDADNSRVRRIAAESRIITTVAGNGSSGNSDYNGPATEGSLSDPVGLAFDADGNLFIADYIRIRKVNAVTGIMTTFAGGGSVLPSNSETIPIATAIFGSMGLAIDASGSVFVADPYLLWAYRVREDGVSTIAGTGFPVPVSDDGPATAAVLNKPSGIAFDRQGNLLIADTQNNRIRRVDMQTGVITTIAGTGVFGYKNGNGQPATNVSLASPMHLTVDAAGNIYFSGRDGARRISAATGTLTTLASEIDVHGIAVDGTGNVYFSEPIFGFVKRVSGSGEVTSYAGGRFIGDLGDGRPAPAARLDDPMGLAVDARGNLLIADSSNRRVRRVDAATGIITSVAAGLLLPTSIAPESSGNMFVTEEGGNTVVEVGPGGLFHIVAGIEFQPGYSGDNGPAASALLNSPKGIAMDSLGNIYIADTKNNRIRVIKR